MSNEKKFERTNFLKLMQEENPEDFMRAQALALESNDELTDPHRRLVCMVELNDLCQPYISKAFLHNVQAELAEMDKPVYRWHQGARVRVN